MTDERPVMTLCMIREGSRLLLGMKKRGFGAGRWNGFGGKVREDESIEAAAIRETIEEADIVPQRLEKVGCLEFRFTADPDRSFPVHVFAVHVYSGQPTESDEMRPHWFDIGKIPYERMWPGDQFWIPLYLAGKKFKGSFVFGEDDAVLERTLEEVHEL